MPDLTMWYKWHRARNTLPAGLERSSLADVARSLGVPAWVVTKPWQVSLHGVELTSTERDGERIERYATAAGTLQARWSRGPDGDWWQMEHLVKEVGDLPAALLLAQAREYNLDEDAIARLPAEADENAVRALELPMRPYADVLHTMLGWSEGLTLFARDGRSSLLEILAVLEEKLRGLVDQVVALPADLLLAPDNLDGQYISGRVFDEYLADSYRTTGQAAARAGKPLVVHAGGPFRRLLPWLANVGVAGVEGVSGPPQGDATLAQARQAAGPELLLWGGIPQDLLVDIHDEADFERAVLDAANQARGDARMILGVADRMPVDAVYGRLARIRELVESDRAKEDQEQT